jgi:superfamily II DNA or RNA helicase
MADYGLPCPQSTKTDLEKELLLYDVDEQRELADLLKEKFPFNAEQQAIFDAVIDAVEEPNESNRFIFASGVAGAGKTLMANRIAAHLRAEGNIVQICASTTLAATLYKNAETAHSKFKYPVADEDAADSDAPPTCR